MNKKIVFEGIIGGLLTFLIVREIIRFLSKDFAFSVISGWHTIIYPPDMTINVLTLIALILSFIVVIINSICKKIIKMLAMKITKIINSRDTDK